MGTGKLVAIRNASRRSALYGETRCCRKRSGGGGIVSSLWNTFADRKRKEDEALPSDMSSTSLLGGGLIAGDALAALGIGIAGLLATLAG